MLTARYGFTPDVALTRQGKQTGNQGFAIQKRLALAGALDELAALSRQIDEEARERAAASRLMWR